MHNEGTIIASLGNSFAAESARGPEVWDINAIDIYVEMTHEHRRRVTKALDRFRLTADVR